MKMKKKAQIHQMMCLRLELFKVSIVEELRRVDAVLWSEFTPSLLGTAFVNIYK